MRTWLIACMALSLAGCAHVSVKDTKRTANPAFDGLWEGDIGGTSPKQSVGLWELTCGERDLDLVAQVADGVISGYLRQDENIAFTTNINDKGRFYYAIPKKPTYTEAAGSDLAVSGNEFFVFRGRLNPDSNSGTGQFVHASSQMGMRGCTTGINFNRQ